MQHAPRPHPQVLQLAQLAEAGRQGGFRVGVQHQVKARQPAEPANAVGQLSRGEAQVGKVRQVVGNGLQAENTWGRISLTLRLWQKHMGPVHKVANEA